MLTMMLTTMMNALFYDIFDDNVDMMKFSEMFYGDDNDTSFHGFV